jgi:hypothetical protein
VPYGYPYTVQGPHCCATYSRPGTGEYSPCDCPPTRAWNPYCGLSGPHRTGLPCWYPPPTLSCPTFACPTGLHCWHPPIYDVPRPYGAMAQPMVPGAGMGAGGQQRAAFPPPTVPHWRCPPVSYAYHCASQFWRCGPPPSIGACPGGGFVPPEWGGGMKDPYAAFGGGYDPYSPYQTGY